MVHQRHQRQLRRAHQRFKQRRSGGMRQFTAQMQQMLGAVQPFAVAVADGVDHLAEVIQPVPAVAHIAHADRVQHRGNAAGNHQRIVAAHRRVCGPVHFRARGEKLVEVIGVQFHQTWQQPGTFTIQRTGLLAGGFAEAADALIAELQ